MRRMDPHEPAVSSYYRVAGLVTREQKDLAVEIIEAEIRHAQYETLLHAAKLVLSGEPIAIARQLHDMAERTMRPTERATGGAALRTIWRVLVIVLLVALGARPPRRDPGEPVV